MAPEPPLLGPGVQVCLGRVLREVDALAKQAPRPNPGAAGIEPVSQDPCDILVTRPVPSQQHGLIPSKGLVEEREEAHRRWWLCNPVCHVTVVPCGLTRTRLLDVESKSVCQIWVDHCINTRHLVLREGAQVCGLPITTVKSASL